MDFKAERVKQINCGKCGASIDPSTVKPLAPIACPACQHRFTAPAAFGDYLLVDVVGHGTAGIVCKAFDDRLHRQVAVKILRTGGEDDALAEACQREARALAKLNDPHVVQVHTIGEYRGQPFIVMELLDGGSVEKRMLGKPVEQTRALDIAIQTAEGLAAAQSVGLVHMDVKPGNILFDRHDVAKLIDFGVARFGKTQDDQILGTPYYVAPEVVHGQPATHQADIYSLGGTLFHLLAGRPPFAGSKLTEVINRRLKQPAPSLTDHRDDLHPKTVAVVARMLEADPEDRYADYQTLLDDLRQARDAAAAMPAAPPPSASDKTATASRTRVIKPTRDTSNMPLLIACGVLSVLVIFGIVMLVVIMTRSESEPQEQRPVARQTSQPAPAPSAESEPPQKPSDTTPAPQPFEIPPLKSEPEPKPEPAPKPEPSPESKAPDKAMTLDKSSDKLQEQAKPDQPAKPPKPEPPPAPKPSLASFDPLYDRAHALADPIGWTTLEITRARSRLGATMTRQSDGSVAFESVPNAPKGQEVYTFTIQTTLDNITGLRIDALSTDSTSPAFDKQITLNHLEATVASVDSPESTRPIKFSEATASAHHQAALPANLLDSDSKTGWATPPNQQQSQHLMLQCDGALNQEAMKVITLTLTFPSHAHAMRRVRISATVDPEPLKLETQPNQRTPKHRIAFVPLKPDAAVSADQATLSIQEDGSVLADADHISPDVYTVTLQTDLKGITAIELEALPHESLRGGGPGTAANGRFTLSEFEVQAAPADQPDQKKPVRIARAIAANASDQYPIDNAIDDNPKTPWFIRDQPGERQVAMFIFDQAVDHPGGSILTVTLRHQQMNLGHFRLGVTTATDPATLAPETPDPADKKDAPEKVAENSIRLYYNLGGADMTLKGVTWEGASKYREGKAGYQLSPGGRRHDSDDLNTPLINSCVLNIRAFRATVPDGVYRVVLVFCELTDQTTTGQRVFSVLAEGRPVPSFANIDPFREAKGRLKPTTRTGLVRVQDGLLDLEFEPSKPNHTPILNAISIIGPR